MKKKTVKGFTLIELIVVLAIFGIIMASAMMLMTPTAKIMATTEVSEQGNAAVTNITRYLDGEISCAEYMRMYNGKYTTYDASNNKYDTSSLNAKVSEFINLYYSGIIKGGSTAASPSYASGEFHVLQIDNERNGMISEWVYTCPNLNDPNTITLDTAKSKECAVNKAYYTDFSFDFKPGSYDSVLEFDAATNDSNTYFNNFTAQNVCMTIKASAQRNNGTYSFVSSLGVPVLNTMYGNKNAVEGVYYCVINKKNGATVTQEIVDRASALAAEQDPSTNVAQHERILSRCHTDNSGNNKGYTFIYAFGSEINTNP